MSDGRGVAGEGWQPGASASGPAVVNHVQPAAGVPEEPGGEGQEDARDADGGPRGRPQASDVGADTSETAIDPDGASQEQGSERDAQEEREEAEEIRELKARDAEVRAHEQAHAAAGGALAGAPRYEYERGPDGRNYATSGEVPIDVAAVSGDPEATIQKMQQVRRAALAPASPSSADRSIASRADQKLAAARRELAEAQAEGSEGELGGLTPASAAGPVGPTEGTSFPEVSGEEGGVDNPSATNSPNPASGLAAFDALRRRASGSGAYAPPAADVGGTIAVLSCSNCGGTHPA